MKPVTFEGANTELTSPQGMEHRVRSIPVFSGAMYDERFPVVVSCHELDSAEMLRIMETKRVFLTTMGESRQPVLLTVDNPVKEGWTK